MPKFAEEGETLHLLVPDDKDKNTCHMNVMNSIFRSGLFYSNSETTDSAKEMILNKLRNKLYIYFLGATVDEKLAKQLTDFKNLELSFVDCIPDKDEHERAYYWHQYSDKLINQ